MMTAVLLVAFLMPALADDAKAAPPAKVTVTAELACLHCTFGQGNHCAACLAVDDKTPVVLEGKAGKQFMEQRLDKKVLVAEGTLSRNKDGRLVLTSDDAHLWTEKDKTTAPAKGEVRVQGAPVCGHCDLHVTESCALAVRNANLPILLTGKLAADCAEKYADAKAVIVTGKLSSDKPELLKLEAKDVKAEKASK